MLLHHDAHCRSTLLRSHDFASLRDERRTGNTNRAPLDTLPETQLFLTTVLFRFSSSLFPLSLFLSLSLSLSLRGRFIERVNILVARDCWHPVIRRNRGVPVILTTHFSVALLPWKSVFWVNNDGEVFSG